VPNDVRNGDTSGRRTRRSSTASIRTRPACQIAAFPSGGAGWRPHWRGAVEVPLRFALRPTVVYDGVTGTLAAVAVLSLPRWRRWPASACPVGCLARSLLGRREDAMAIPEADVARVKEWAATNVPEHVRDKLWVEADVDGHAVTVYECRPAWPEREGAPPMRVPTARLRYVAAHQEWRLYWCDSNDRYHRYDPMPSAKRVTTLLRAIDDDVYCLFWG